MKLLDLVGLLKKHRLNVVTKDGYTNPVDTCSRWILLDGEVYGEHKFQGNFLVDVEKIVLWSKKQAEQTWVNQENIERAKNYFAEWISKADLGNETPTLLDTHQREFLKSHISTFIDMKCFKTYCPSCATFYEEVVEGPKKKSGAGKIIGWTDEYLCPEGHSLYSQEEEIRLF